MKISGSWASLLRGVSQQAPEVRQSGQHAEQVNLLSDPIAGLTRRQGTRRITSQTYLNVAPTGGNDIVSQGYRKVEHVTGAKDYVLFLREKNFDPAWNPDAYMPPIMAYNQVDKAFIPIDWDDAPTQAVAFQMGQRGITAAVSLGRFFAFALNGLQASQGTAVQWVSNPSQAVAWVRGGAFDRTYKITLADGREAAYTTPSAGDTGAATAISPQNIAQKLAEALVALSPSVTAYAGGTSHVLLAPGMGISVSDGGDGSLLRGMYATVDAVDKLTLLAVDGMVIRVQAGPDAYFFMKAVAKSGATGGLTEVRWMETAGVTQAVTVSNFFVGSIFTNGKIRMASSPAALNVVDPPKVVASTAGDLTSNEAPAFLRGRQITYLGQFQDRLLIGAGAALAVSAAGDYFNFFRSTLLTVPAKDGFEMIAQGGEDDYLRHSVPYSRNLVIFGDKRQYVINGTAQLTGLSPNMAVMTTYADAATVPPIAAGGQLYYLRNKEGNVAVHQIQPGAFVDSAESFPASAQIGDYIKSPANQIEVIPGAPSQLLVTSRVAPRMIFTFSFLDQPDGRKQDAWSRWEFNQTIGALIGVHSTPDGLLVFWSRINGVGNWDFVADLLPLATTQTDVPFFDSARKYDEDHVVPSPANWSAAFGRTSERYLIGGKLSEVAALLDEYPTEQSHLWIGLDFPCYVIPTNPYTRDNQQLAILTGRTVVTSYAVNMRNSAGMTSTITTASGSKVFTFNARVLGDPLNRIGKVPVSSGVHTVPIGREVREFAVKLEALKWFPFTLIGMEWTGQSFNRTPRA